MGGLYYFRLMSGQSMPGRVFFVLCLIWGGEGRMKRAMTALAATAAALVVAVPLSGPAYAATPASTVDWKPCADAPGVDCGTVTVPIDWSRPGGRARAAAGSPARCSSTWTPAAWSATWTPSGPPSATAG